MTAQMPRSLGHMRVGSLFKTAAVRHPDREAVFCAGTGRRVTFKQLNSRVNQLAHALASCELEREAVVAFVCSNRLEILEIYGAIAKSGLVGLPLNYRLAHAELALLINEIGAVVLFLEDRFEAALPYLRAHCAKLKHVVWIGAEAPPDCWSYGEVLAMGAVTEPDVAVEESAPFYFNLTSGTTGLPKAYVITHYSACALLSALLSNESKADDVLLTIFPAFGRVAFGCLLMTILIGARNVLANFEPGEAARLIEQERVTFVWLVPTMAALLLGAPDIERRGLGSLRGIGFVGAALPPAILERSIQRLCPRIYEGYGLQEAGMVTVSNPEDRARKPGSVGLPVLHCEIRIVDGDGEPAASGASGEIVVRSPNCITEYHGDPARNASAFRSGWFHTGDLGRVDADGYLYLCGRVKDMIISGGQNVYASEIEATLTALPGVEDCAVIGMPHDLWGEAVTAVIVAHPQASLDAAAVQAFCRRALAAFKVPKSVFFQEDALPRTATGKVQKFLLVARYAKAAGP